MIRNESEYQELVKRIQETKVRLNEQKEKLKEMDLSSKEIKRALDPMRSFLLQLEEELEEYEQLKRGDLGKYYNLQGIGRLLIAARIARNITQRGLAEKLGVHESQVSRDERNEYHGVTVERAGKILNVLGVKMHSEVQLESA